MSSLMRGPPDEEAEKGSKGMILYSRPLDRLEFL